MNAIRKGGYSKGNDRAQKHIQVIYYMDEDNSFSNQTILTLK